MNTSAWGKFESDSEFHCLEHHCADVAACFEILIQDSVLRRRIEHAANIPKLDEITATRMAVIAFFHDFAKINSGFQYKVRNCKNKPPKAGHIREAYYCFEQVEIMKALGFVSMCENWGEGFEPLLLAALTHHGRPPSDVFGSGPASYWLPVENYYPQISANRLGTCCRSWFPKAFQTGPSLPNTPALAHLFAGLVSIADQIGSATEDFPFHPVPNDQYIEIARKQAIVAVNKRGLLREGRNQRAKPVSYGFPRIRGDRSG